MERVGGIKISDIAGLDRAGIDRRRVAETSVRLMLREAFEFGFFHADPHAGNLFVRPDAGIVLVDYGNGRAAGQESARPAAGDGRCAGQRRRRSPGRRPICAGRRQRPAQAACSGSRDRASAGALWRQLDEGACRRRAVQRAIQHRLPLPPAPAQRDRHALPRDRAQRGIGREPRSQLRAAAVRRPLSQAVLAEAATRPRR